VKFVRMRFPGTERRLLARSASEISLGSEGRICTATVETIGRRGAGGPYRSRFPLIPRSRVPGSPSSCSLLFLLVFVRAEAAIICGSRSGDGVLIAVLLLFLLVVRRERRPGYVTLFS